MNLTNAPLDRRRLSAEDRAIYSPAKRQSAAARTRAYRGQMAWDNNSQKQTQTARPGSGGFTMGRYAQQSRLRDEGAKVERSKRLRNEGAIYTDDPAN